MVAASGENSFDKVSAGVAARVAWVIDGSPVPEIRMQTMSQFRRRYELVVGLFIIFSGPVSQAVQPALPSIDDLMSSSIIATSGSPKAAYAGDFEAVISETIASPQWIAKGLKAAGEESVLRTRGARDVSQYRQYSPSVALIVTNDSIGSGFLVDPSGSIVTNKHVVGQQKQVVVVFKPLVEGSTPSKADAVSASVVKVDEVADLALLKVQSVPVHVSPLALGFLGDVEVGADVFAIGHPTGEAWTYTKGIVSQVRRNYEWSTEAGVKHSASIVQTQTPINPGNSGGPLIDEKGRVIGVNSFKSGGEGLNYAVSVDDVRDFISRPGSRRSTPLANSKQPDQVQESKCKVVTIERRRSKDQKSTVESKDFDCDGRPDGVLIIPDDASEEISLLIDTNEDGKVDYSLVDTDRDGQIDLEFSDTDFDGKLDLIGYYRKGENKPYRYERLDS